VNEKSDRTFHLNAAAQADLPHQIIRHFEVGVRIVFILLFLTQRAV
jgi:hypothetical protein